MVTRQARTRLVISPTKPLGQQSALHLAPQRLELAVGVGAIRKRRLMQNAETAKSSNDLGRGHGRAFITHKAAGQTAPLKGLRETMRDNLRPLVAQLCYEQRYVESTEMALLPLRL